MGSDERSLCLGRSGEIIKEGKMKSLCLLKGVILFLIFSLGSFFELSAEKEDAGKAQVFFVSTKGNDNNPGSIKKSFASIEGAKIAVSKIEKKDKPIYVYLREGTYFLSQPIKFLPEDSGSRLAPVIYCPYKDENVVISGGVKLKLKWEEYKNGIMQAKLDPKKYDGIEIDQLFVNGECQRMARYPNYDPSAKYFGGTSPDAISVERVKSWKNPAGGYLHALFKNMWCSRHYRIEGVNKDYTLKLRGGWQSSPHTYDGEKTYSPDYVLKRLREEYFRDDYHREILFVENIFEELDEPGEWYFDNEKNILYLMPQKGVNLSRAEIIGANLKQLFVFQGSSEEPVKFIKIKGFSFKQTSRIFLEPYECLLRGDWSIARLAAIFFEGTEDCEVSDCNFEDLGGNCIFLSGYNRRTNVMNSRFVNIGESAVCLVGDIDAVRSPAIAHSNFPLDEIDLIPGPKSPDYPMSCTIENNLMHHLGLVGKQVAGVFISMSEEINVRHNTIYHVARAGICLNDGCWGGHIIEWNDVFDAVRESCDHGPFNSWGRDRYYRTIHHYGADKSDVSKVARERSLLDTYKTILLRYNRFSHPGGFSCGVDLDDGSSNWDVYSNLCLGMEFGIKCREGFFRSVKNNIIINGCIAPEISFENCGDVFTHNIIVNENVYDLIVSDPHDAGEFDYNLFYWEDGEPFITRYENILSGGDWRIGEEKGQAPYFARLEEPLLEEKRQELEEVGWDKKTPGGRLTRILEKWQEAGKPKDVIDFYGIRMTMTIEKWQERGFDQHSVVADPMFVDPEHGDYRVKAGSPALKLGFQNFPMDNFGVDKPEFVKEASQADRTFQER